MTSEQAISGMHHAEELSALEQFVVENDDLLALESLIGRFNIFDALDIARAEIRHSNFLAFILDPAESHGQGQLFLKAVLTDLLKAAPAELRPLSPIELDGTDLRGVEVKREWNHVDLLITCEQPAFVVAIENKVGSLEHSNQLSRYKDIVRVLYSELPRLYVYLTPDADEPSDKKWVAYSYADLYGVLARVLKTYRKAIGEDVRVFLDHYLNLIGTRFMNNPEIDALCQRIYKNHRQALDLIWERVGTASSVLAAAAAVLGDDPRWHVFYQTNRYIAFVPQTWLAWLPGLGLEKDPRSWIILRLYLYEDKLEFIVQVRPMQDSAKRKEIVQLLIAELPKLGFIKSGGGKGEGTYTRVSGADRVKKWREDEEPEEEAVRTALKEKLDDIYPKLEGIPSLLKPLLGLS